MSDSDLPPDLIRLQRERDRANAAVAAFVAAHPGPPPAHLEREWEALVQAEIATLQALHAHPAMAGHGSGRLSFVTRLRLAAAASPPDEAAPAPVPPAFRPRGNQRSGAATRGAFLFHRGSRERCAAAV